MGVYRHGPDRQFKILRDFEVTINFIWMSLINTIDRGKIGARTN